MSLVISKVFTYDTDAGNYIQAVEAADQADTPGIGALEPAVRQAINNFVVGCKQDGIWNAIKASCILAGAKTLEGSFIDLKSATKILTNNNFADGTYVGSNYTTGDYNRKTGLVGNGSTKYLDSNRNNNADPQDSKHISVFVTSAQTVSSVFMGTANSLNTPGDCYMFTSAASGSTARLHSSGTGQPVSVPIAVVNNIAGLSRSSSSNFQARFNGFNYTSSSDTSQSPISQNIHVFKGGSQYANPRLAFYSIGEAIDLARLDSRVTDLIAAFNNPLVIP